MKRGVNSEAFTIVETMIFLVVTAALLAGVVSTIGVQQRRTQFDQSIREIQGRMDDVINNVQAGYYNSPSNLRCRVSGASLAIDTSGAGDTRGQNIDCVYIGRVMQFKVAGKNDDYNVYSVAGRRYDSASKQLVTSLEDSYPKAISVGNAIEDYKLEYGLEPRKMYYIDSSSTRHDVGAVGFITNFQQYSTGSADIESGASSIDLIPIKGTDLDINNSVADAEAGIEDLKLVSPPSAAPDINPPGGVVLCLYDPGTKQYGVITIGGSGSRLSTNLVILTESKATTYTVPGTGVCA